jgi:hypothetical protein
VFGIEQKADIDMKKMWGVSALTLRRAIALMPLAALAASIERAEAACDATAPVDNTVITCSGTTTNPNGAAGFGGPNDVGNTYNILSGASIRGISIGLQMDAGSINNAKDGTITGGVYGIFANTLVTVDSAGTISGGGAGISAGSVDLKRNTGTITGGSYGILADTLVTVDSAGTISATAADGIGIQANSVDVKGNTGGTI